jgi:hypothetical protein
MRDHEIDVWLEIGTIIGDNSDREADPLLELERKVIIHPDMIEHVTGIFRSHISLQGVMDMEITCTMIFINLCK